MRLAALDAASYTPAADFGHAGGRLPSKLGRVVVLLLAVGQLVAVPLLRFEYLRFRWAFAAALVVDGYLALRVFRASSQPERLRLAAFLGLPACILAAVAAPSAYAMSLAAVPLLLGWSAPLAILAWGPADADVSSFSVNRRLLFAMWLVAAVGLWVAFLPDHRPHIIDEHLYLMQSQYMWRRPFMRPLDPDLVSFFQIGQSYSTAGYINGQYPPGWPLVLSIASTLKAAWLVVFGAYALLITGTFLFGRAVAGTGTGLLAAVLVTFDALTLRLATTFMPHVLEAALALLAGALVVGTPGAPPWRRTGAWVLAGFLMGFAIAVRPLTGVALAAMLWLWVVLREHPTPRTAIGAALAALAGGAIPVAFILYYNFETTGAVLRFGYDVAEHGLHALGFGRRGFVEYTLVGVPVERSFTFGPLLALSYAKENLHAAFIDFFTATTLIVPVTYVALRNGVQWKWRPMAAFLTLPLAYFFYFYHTPWLDRFYFEILPFLMVGAAYLLHELAQRRRSVGYALGALLIATMLVDTTILAITLQHDKDTNSSRVAAVVDRLHAEHSKLLVFVRSDLPRQPVDPGSEPIQWWPEPGMDALYWYNIYGFPSDVVVARDIGARDTVLARRFPQRYAVRLIIRAAHFGEPWRIETRQLEPNETAHMQ